MQNKNYTIEVITAEKTWIESFDPGTRTHEEIIDEIQTFLDEEEYGDNVTLHIHMPKEEHPAVVE